MRAVKFPPPILAEFGPVWSKFDQLLVFCTPIEAKLDQFGKKCQLGRSAKIGGGN
jgi:hypothetical protein